MVPGLKKALVPEVTAHMNEHQNLEAENFLCICPAGENLVRYAAVMTY